MESEADTSSSIRRFQIWMVIFGLLAMLIIAGVYGDPAGFYGFWK
ncbi:MAG: hypothetical protein WC835_01120 [Candidatus Paceibacterota bacterium]|jgi:hypothetical protein